MLHCLNRATLFKQFCCLCCLGQRVRYNSKFNSRWDEDYPVLQRLLIECQSEMFSFHLVLQRWRRAERTVAKRSQFYWRSWAQSGIYWSSSDWCSTTKSLCCKKSNTYVLWRLKLNMMRSYWFVWLRRRTKWRSKDKSLRQQETQIWDRLFTFLWEAA